MERIRLAFIGCGGHATGLMWDTSGLPEIDLIAVCDLDGERARTTARRFGALAWYTDFQKMLDAEQPDAVAVVGPPMMEIEIGSAVLDQGFHLYAEKPIGRNSREAQPLVEAARRAKGKTQVGFNQRHAGMMRQGKLLVDQPDFGRPTYVESRHWQTGRLHSIWGIEDLQYAWLMLHGIHAVDMLRHLFGEVVEVFALKSRSDEAGSLVGLCRFDNGANGLLNLHSQTGTGDQFFEAVGTGRTVRVTGFDELSYYSSNRWAPNVNARQGQFIRYGHGTMRGDAMGYRTEFQNFAMALLAGEAPSPSIPDGYESTRLAEAFYGSILTGQPVKVAEAPVIEV